jgi:hypothetical protein
MISYSVEQLVRAVEEATYGPDEAPLPTDGPEAE